MHSNSLCCEGEAAKGKAEGEVCTHQKGIISAKSRLFKTTQTAASLQLTEEMGSSCARTGFQARQPGGDGASPATMDWELEKKYGNNLKTGSGWI